MAYRKHSFDPIDLDRVTSRGVAACFESGA